MKKIITSIALILSASLCFSGCGLMGGSCSGGSSTPTYTSAWTNTQEDTIGLSETLTYDVNYQDDLTIGKTSYKNTVKKTVMDFSYGTGTYSTTVTVVKAEKSLLGEYSSEVLNDIVDSTDQSILKRIFKYTTRLDIPFTYKYGDMTDYVTNNDFIQTETYMLLSGNSFAPIFTENTTYVSFVSAGKSPFVEQQHYDTVTIYNNKTLTTTTKVYYTKAENDHEIGDIADEKTTTSKYSFRSTLENAALLFAFRSLDLSGKTTTVSVYSHVYTSPKSLNISSAEAAAERFNITLNGTVIPEEEIQLNAYSFVLNTTSGCTTGRNTGRSQIFYINKSMETPPQSIGSNRTLIMRYVEPLVEYSSYNSMGALVYSLRSIDF